VEALRIEAGRPAFGTIHDCDTIPLEAGLLDRAISTTKGCYVGRKSSSRCIVVADEWRSAGSDGGRAGSRRGASGRRRHALGRARRGLVTSAAWSPARTRRRARYAHRDAAEPGRRLMVRTGTGDAAATIVALAG
jgi:glycine cleavage system aminomethyltransferase T